MALNTYIRNKSFFRLLRDNEVNIDSINIDSEYVKVIDYLNNQVVPSINAIIDAAFGGIIGSDGFYLQNVGDGTTKWSQMEIMINDYSLPFSKLSNKTVGSLLVSNEYGNISSVTSNNINELLVSQANSTPVWQLLKTENIEDLSITGDDIADNEIRVEHLKGDFNIVDVPNNLVVGNNFTDLCITAQKFLPGSVGISKLGPLPEYNTGFRGRRRPLFNMFSTLETHRGGAGNVKNKHIKNGTLREGKFNFNSINPNCFNRVKCVTKRKIAPETIDDSLLLTYEPYSGVTTDLTTHACIHASKIRSMKINSTKLGVYSNNYLEAADFTPEVWNAFSRFGCIGQG